MRLFFAVVPDGGAVESLGAVTAGVRRDLGNPEGLRWTRPDAQHLTVHFLGEIDEARAGRIVALCDEAPIEADPFDVTLGGLGVFPPSGPVRALWVGVERGGESLARVHDVLGARLVRLGVALEERRFTPHLTLARVRRGGRPRGLRRRLADVRPLVSVRWRVDAVTLLESDTSGSGPRYRTLARLALGHEGA